MKSFQFRKQLTIGSSLGEVGLNASLIFRSGIISPGYYDEVLDFRTEASNVINALVNYLLENAEALEGATVEIFGVEENTVYIPHVQIKFADEVVGYIVAEESLGTAK
jgi:hypothetical protein|tara:strand:+ start:424 stop:747 length:324 start_codon:yes stop_codon:yes gene_type:complete